MPSIEYLAGYFDGEGSVCFLNKTDHKYASLRVVIASADYETLKCFYEKFGGSFKEAGGYKKPAKRRMYRWFVSGRFAQAVLKQLLPYLIAKRAQAELALKINIEYWKGRPLSQEEIKLRAEVAAQVKAINHRNDFLSSTSARTTPEALA